MKPSPRKSGERVTRSRGSAPSLKDLVDLKTPQKTLRRSVKTKLEGEEKEMQEPQDSVESMTSLRSSKRKSVPGSTMEVPKSVEKQSSRRTRSLAATASVENTIAENSETEPESRNGKTPVKTSKDKDMAVESVSTLNDKGSTDASSGKEESVDARVPVLRTSRRSAACSADSTVDKPITPITRMTRRMRSLAAVIVEVPELKSIIEESLAEKAATKAVEEEPEVTENIKKVGVKQKTKSGKSEGTEEMESVSGSEDGEVESVSGSEDGEVEGKRSQRQETSSVDVASGQSMEIEDKNSAETCVEPEKKMKSPIPKKSLNIPEANKETVLDGTAKSAKSPTGKLPAEMSVEESENQEGSNQALSKVREVREEEIIHFISSCRQSKSPKTNKKDIEESSSKLVSKTLEVSVFDTPKSSPEEAILPKTSQKTTETVPELEILKVVESPKTPKSTKRQAVEKLSKTPKETPENLSKTPKKTPENLSKTPKKTPENLSKTPKKTPEKPEDELSTSDEDSVEELVDKLELEETMTEEVTPSKTPKKTPQKHGDKPSANDASDEELLIDNEESESVILDLGEEMAASEHEESLDAVNEADGEEMVQGVKQGSKTPTLEKVPTSSKKSAKKVKSVPFGIAKASADTQDGEEEDTEMLNDAVVSMNATDRKSPDFEEGTNSYDQVKDSPVFTKVKSPKKIALTEASLAEMVHSIITPLLKGVRTVDKVDTQNKETVADPDVSFLAISPTLLQREKSKKSEASTPTSSKTSDVLHGQGKKKAILTHVEEPIVIEDSEDEEDERQNLELMKLIKKLKKKKKILKALEEIGSDESKFAENVESSQVEMVQDTDAVDGTEGKESKKRKLANTEAESSDEKKVKLTTETDEVKVPGVIYTSSLPFCADSIDIQNLFLKKQIKLLYMRKKNWKVELCIENEDQIGDAVSLLSTKYMGNSVRIDRFLNRVNTEPITDDDGFRYNQVYVNKISPYATETDITSLFPKAIRCDLPKKKSGVTKGFCYLTFPDRATAREHLLLNGKVNLAGYKLGIYARVKDSNKGVYGNLLREMLVHITDLDSVLIVENLPLSLHKFNLSALFPSILHLHVKSRSVFNKESCALVICKDAEQAEEIMSKDIMWEDQKLSVIRATKGHLHLATKPVNFSHKKPAAYSESTLVVSDLPDKTGVKEIEELFPSSVVINVVPKKKYALVGFSTRAEMLKISKTKEGLITLKNKPVSVKPYVEPNKYLIESEKDFCKLLHVRGFPKATTREEVKATFKGCKISMTETDGIPYAVVKCKSAAKARNYLAKENLVIGGKIVKLSKLRTILRQMKKEALM